MYSLCSGCGFSIESSGCAISRYILLRFVPSRVDSEGTLRFFSYSTIVLSSGGLAMVVHGRTS